MSYRSTHHFEVVTCQAVHVLTVGRIIRCEPTGRIGLHHLISVGSKLTGRKTAGRTTRPQLNFHGRNINKSLKLPPNCVFSLHTSYTYLFENGNCNFHPFLLTYILLLSPPATAQNPFQGFLVRGGRISNPGLGLVYSRKHQSLISI